MTFIPVCPQAQLLADKAVAAKDELTSTRTQLNALVAEQEAVRIVRDKVQADLGKLEQDLNAQGPPQQPSALETVDITHLQEDDTDQNLNLEAKTESLQSRVWKSSEQLEAASKRLKELDAEVMEPRIETGHQSAVGLHVVLAVDSMPLRGSKLQVVVSQCNQSS